MYVVANTGGENACKCYQCYQAASAVAQPFVWVQSCLCRSNSVSLGLQDSPAVILPVGRGAARAVYVHRNAARGETAGCWPHLWSWG